MAKPEQLAPMPDAAEWRDRTLMDAFDDVVRRTPEKLVIVAGDTRLTYADLARQVRVVAHNLFALGVKAGDVVSIQLPNWTEFFLVHLAATLIGAVTNPLLPIYRAKELSHILKIARSKVAVIPSGFRDFEYPTLYEQLWPTLPELQEIFVVGRDRPSSMRAFSDLLDEPNPQVSIEGTRTVSGSDTAVLIFTSGTEAAPKGVVHSHDTMMYSNITAARVLELTSQEIIWGVSPIAHATGLEWCVRLGIVLGATIVLQETWEREAALDLIEKERCTFTTGATPFAAMLLESPSLERRKLTSFKKFLCGGATIPPSLGSALFERVGCRLIPCWGMSECFAATMCSPSDCPQKQWGSDGRAVPGSEIAIFDESRTRALGPNEVGEIATRGPHVCRGYYQDPERTAETFSRDGWLFSNDLGTLDGEGYLHVVGRKKDIINRAGLKISAAEVESLLSEHRLVRAAAVISVPDNRLGEKACVFVVPTGGEAPSLEGLTTWLTEKGLAAYKLPEYLVLVPELPMTPTGKVQKFKLRELWDTGDFLALN